MIDVKVIVGLLCIHYLCDYTHLSTGWMLKAKRFGTPLYPIFIHAFFHASFMLVFLSLYGGYSNGRLLAAFSLQLGSHFIIDVLKGRLNKWYPPVSDSWNKIHWCVFGLDQLLHQLVIVLMCCI